MKSSLGTSFLKATLLIVLFAWCQSGPTGAQGGGKDQFSPGPVRPGNLDYRTELPQGYLKVYSATDEFSDGDALYFPHSSYAIYTIDGKLIKNVTSQLSVDEEIPEVVRLPVGFYMVVARSEKNGYIRLPVAIKTGQRTVLDLDLRQEGTLSG